jgi:S1-C subfamily serine protease
MDGLPDSQLELWRQRLKRFVAPIRRVLPFGSGVLAALAAIFLYSTFSPKIPQLTINDINDTVAQALASATPPPSYSSRVYQIIHPSLVLIQTQGRDANDEVENSLGSGVIIDEAGSILTSLHVVAEANDILLTFADGSEANAQIAATQPENDIAVLVADRLPEQFLPATLGNPNAMQVGDEAFAVGNPFGLYGSMSAGVISGFNRSFEVPDSQVALDGLIQIDAAVNPGNSGGPLLNRNGAVIGIVVGIVNPTEQEVFIGIGFAVPIDIAGGAAGLPPY